LYLSGLSFDQIAAKTGASKGSVENIINELKAGNFPEAADVTDQIETLRELAVDLAKLKMPTGKSAVGIAVLKRIYELGLDPADMERWPLLLNAIKTSDDAQELIQAAYTVRDIQKKSGLSLPALENKVKQISEKAEELESLTVKITKAHSDINGLNKKKTELSPEVTSLDGKFKWLVPRVQELEQREKQLLDQNKSMLMGAEKAKGILETLKAEMKKLDKIGLSVKALVDFNKELVTVAKHHGIKAPMVRKRLLGELKHLDKGFGLETLVKKQEQTLKETTQLIDKRKGELSSCEAALKSLQQQKQNLEASIKETREYISQEIAQLVPIAKDTVKQITIDLKSGCGEVISEVKHLKDEALLVGEDVGKLKNIVAEAEWVQKLVMLQQGKDINAADTRTIALLVNHGINAWLNQHGAQSTAIKELALTSGDYIRRLEEWDVGE
jgi:predicted  nucleic acid-binding Zn-ribbon protein